MASLTFAQAKTLLAPYISSVGASDPVVASAINFVNERFITSGEWKGNRFIHSFSVSQDPDSKIYYIDTVPGIESILKVAAIDPDYETSEIADIMSDWYPWIDQGMGVLPANYAGDTQVIRMGATPSYPLPSGDGSGHYTADTQRYRILGKVPETRTMYCIVRRGYVPLVNDTDLLIPSNRNAYRYGVQAYNYENINELERAQVYWQLSYQCLNEATQSFEAGEQANIDIQTRGFAAGTIQNLI
jgi:hypothetical protein